MTAKDFLQRGRHLGLEIEQLKEARQKSFDEATSITVDYSQSKVQTSSGNSMERKMLKYVNYCETLDKRIEYLSEYRKEMLELINKLDNSTYRTLLIARYINCHTWEQVAEGIHYNLKWTYVLHGRALQAIEIHYASVL